MRRNRHRQDRGTAGTDGRRRAATGGRRTETRRNRDSEQQSQSQSEEKAKSSSSKSKDGQILQGIHNILMQDSKRIRTGRRSKPRNRVGT